MRRDGPHSWPATARTFRGAASQIATAETALHAIAIQNASV
jgi:hypothetical protein